MIHTFSNFKIDVFFITLRFFIKTTITFILIITRRLINFTFILFKNNILNNKY